MYYYVVVISATVYQMIRDNKRSKSRPHNQGYMEVPSGGTKLATTNTVSPVESKSSFADKMVDAFSLIKNVPYVFSVPSWQPTNITANAYGMSTQQCISAEAEKHPEAPGTETTSAITYGATGTANMVHSLDHGRHDNYETVRIERGATNVARSPTFERFGFLDGLRSLSMIWIILGHTMTICSLNGITNPAIILPPTGLLIHLGAQFFLTSRFAVDTFFFISGFLVSVSLLKRLVPTYNNNSSGKSSGSRPPMVRWLTQFYLHRLLRILPPYIFCLILWWKVGVLLGSGPFWIKWSQYASRCDEYFWTNLLFINNIYPYEAVSEDQCFYVSWYLANDMQFYFLSPLFIVAFLRKKIFGVLLTATVVLFSAIYAFRWTFDTSGSANSFDGADVLVYSQEFYSKPHFRFPPYGIGIIVGMLRTWQKKRIGARMEGHPSRILQRSV